MIHKPAKGICGRASATEIMSIRKKSKFTTWKEKVLASALPRMSAYRMTVAEGEDDLESPRSAAVARGQRWRQMTSGGSGGVLKLKRR